MTLSIPFTNLTAYLDSILERNTVDCKQYDYKAIQYTSTGLLTVILNSETISTNITQIILYSNGESVKILCTTPHLTEYKYPITEIETLEVEC